MLVHAEVVTPRTEERSSRTPGLIGAVLAVLTMAAAFGVGILAVFGRFLLAAAIITFSWRAVFTREFTQWAFGSPELPFWKVFLSLVAAAAVLKLLWRQSWLRK